MKTKPFLAIPALLCLCIGCGQEVKIVEVDPPSILFTRPTQSEKITAKATEMRGEVIAGISFEYHSDNTAVATVNSDGVVKPAGNGSAAILATAPNGVKGESFVKVCLPKAIICDPEHELQLRVGTAAPIRCHLEDCKDEKIPGKIEYQEASAEMLFKDEESTFVGKVVGDTTVTVKAMGMEKVIKVHIDEQIFSPGMEPGSGGGGGGGGGGKKAREKDPYNDKSGKYDHIIGNIKF